MDIEPFTTIKSYAPLCYWRMDEASGSLVNSGSAASKNATATALTYSQTKIATRSPKTSVSFNGSTSFAEVAAGVIGGVNPTFSVGCWINTTTSSTKGLICQRDGTNGGSGFEFKLNGGVFLSFQGVTTSGVNDFSMLSEQLSPLNDGIPHYVGATVYSDNVALFCDGVCVGEFGGRNGGTWSATPKIFLGQINGGTERYVGTMSDAFITSQVLTQDDHYKIWRNGMDNDPSAQGSNFLDAVEISVPVSETTLTALDLSDYTIEPNEPGWMFGLSDDFLDSGHSAWYKFTSTDAGDRMRISGYGNSPYFSYHYVEAFKDIDGDINNLEFVGQSVGYAPSLSVIVEADTTYYIRLRSYFLYPTVIDLTYEYDTPPPPPANDDFADATLINVTTSGSIAGQLDGSTIEFPLETDNYTSEPNSIWYKFVADATGDITFDTAASPGVDMVLQGFDDMTLADLEADPYMAPWYDNDTGPGGTVLMTMSVISGNTYYIQASDFGTLSNFTMSWTDIV